MEGSTRQLGSDIPLFPFPLLPESAGSSYTKYLTSTYHSLLPILTFPLTVTPSRLCPSYFYHLMSLSCSPSFPSLLTRLPPLPTPTTQPLSSDRCTSGEEAAVVGWLSRRCSDAALDGKLKLKSIHSLWVHSTTWGQAIIPQSGHRHPVM